MIYGALPKTLGKIESICNEMMFYQDLPIKMQGDSNLFIEKRIEAAFGEIIGRACCDFVGDFGLNEFISHNIYISAKNLYQPKGNSFNRGGWHADGFMTNDINYIWSNNHPTIFNNSKFKITQDENLSMVEMNEQALPENNFSYDDCELLRLNQFVVHKVAPVAFDGVRAFLKVSFSKDKYNLLGNSHNHLINYQWEMRTRGFARNVPQVLNT